MTHPTTHVNEWNRKTVQTIKTAQTIYTYIKSAIEIKEPSKSSSSFANCMGIIELLNRSKSFSDYSNLTKQWPKYKYWKNKYKPCNFNVNISYSKNKNPEVIIDSLLKPFRFNGLHYGSFILAWVISEWKYECRLTINMRLNLPYWNLRSISVWYSDKFFWSECGYSGSIARKLDPIFQSVIGFKESLNIGVYSLYI